MAKLLVIGVGAGVSKRYLIEGLLARGYEPVVLAERLPEWLEPLGVRGETAQPLTAAVPAGLRDVDGVLTFDEAYVELTAEIAAGLSLPGLSRAAAASCRDKHLMRRRLAEAGVPSARSVIAQTPEEAARAAAAIGYPVVLKPRNLGGSIGVVRAENEAEVRELFETAATAVFARIDTLPGLLVEEYLDGPEFSVESLVDDGIVRICAVTEKLLGFAPYFEEIGHFCRPFDERRDAGIGRLVRSVHAALGLTLGATHCELRLTATGPRVIEIGARLAGDRIPDLVRRATGIDLIAAAAQLATGKSAEAERTEDRVAGIRMLYPPHDGVVVELGVRGEPAAEVGWYAEAGQHVALPPRGFLSRLGYLTAVGPDKDTVVRLLDESESALVLEVRAGAESGGEVAPQSGEAPSWTDFERAGWGPRAEAYHRFFAPICLAAADAVLDAVRAEAGRRVLDACCGPGYLAGKAMERGCAASGIDLSEAMVDLAGRLYPAGAFRSGDVERLPYPDAAFDAIVCNIGIHHVADPVRALTEFRRVLAPGGRIALTVWDETRSEVGIVKEAIMAVDPIAPPGLPKPLVRPDYVSEDEIRGLMDPAGLRLEEIAPLDLVQRYASPQALWDAWLPTAIRTAPLFEAQPEAVRRSAREVFADMVAKHVGADGAVELQAGLLLITATG